MELIKKEKKGGIRIMPKNKQTAYLTQVEYKGHKFKFFRDRGCIVSKNLRKDYVSQQGEMFVVQDFDYNEIRTHFENLGYKIIDLDKKIENKKIVEDAAKKLNKEAALDLSKNKKIIT